MKVFIKCFPETYFHFTYLQMNTCYTRYRTDFSSNINTFTNLQAVTWVVQVYYDYISRSVCSGYYVTSCRIMSRLHKSSSQAIGGRRRCTAYVCSHSAGRSDLYTFYIRGDQKVSVISFFDNNRVCLHFT